MLWYEAGALMLGLVLVLLALGMPVFLAFLAANSVGVILFMGGLRGLEQLVSNGTISISNFLFVPVPLFILMGELFFHAGLGTRVFDAFDRLLGRVPGRLSRTGQSADGAELHRRTHPGLAEILLKVSPFRGDWGRNNTSEVKIERHPTPCDRAGLVLIVGQSERPLGPREPEMCRYGRGVGEEGTK